MKPNFKAFIYALLSFVIVLAFGQNILISLICFCLLYIIGIGFFKYIQDADLPKDLDVRTKLENDNSNDVLLKQLVSDCTKTINSLQKNSFTNKKIEMLVISIQDLSKKIIKIVEVKHLSQMRNFFDYYIPETDKILKKYNQVSNLITDGTEQFTLDENVVNLLSNINDSLKKILQGMYEDDLASIKTDMDILQVTLKSDGFVNGLERGE